MSKETFLILLPMFISFVECGKILFYMAFVHKSMVISFLPLAEELASRGHEVTIIMPFEYKEQKKNLKVIDFDSAYETFMSSASQDLLKEGGVTVTGALACAVATSSPKKQ